MKNFWKFGLLFLVGGFVLGVGSCVDSLKADIEEVNFLMDQGKFSEAVVKAQSVYGQNPTNVEAQYVLATALLSDGMLNGTSACPKDKGFFGLMACLQDNPSGNETAFTTFEKIAPAADKISEIEEARDLLIGLTSTISAGTQLSTVYLQLYFARLFEIAGATTNIGDNTNELCNAGEPSLFKDSLPDNLATALSVDERDRLEDNLSNLDHDGQQAGFPSDFGLTERAGEILQALQDAANFEAFLNDQYSDSDKATCNVPK